MAWLGGLRGTRLKSERQGIQGRRIWVDLWDWNVSLPIFLCHVNSHQETSTKGHFCTTDDLSSGYQPASDLGHLSVGTGRS